MILKLLSEVDSKLKSDVENLHQEIFVSERDKLRLDNTYVFTINDQLIGYVELGAPGKINMMSAFGTDEYKSLSEKKQYACHGIYLKYIGINSKYRRQGYGTQIMKESIKKIRNRLNKNEVNDSVLVIIESNTTNSASAFSFFKKNGFTELGARMREESLDCYYSNNIKI
jgi:ribosomal protein S18 acetylase RimI-like enzyme